MTVIIEEQKLEIKRKLLSEGLRVQKGVVDTARAAMMDAQESATEEEGDAEEKLFTSYREEMQKKRDMFARQLEHALEELAILNKVATDKESETVAFGSVVVTDTQQFFVSISLGQVKVDGQSFIALSTSAPLYKEMAGKKKGDTFMFRNQLVKIQELF